MTAAAPASVRPAVVSDAPAIAHVHVASWQAAYDGLLPAEFLSGLSVDARERFWARNLADLPAHQTILVAVTPDGSLAGFAATNPGRDEDATAETGELASLYLLPSQWSRGVGRLLHAAAVAALTAEFSTATLWVLTTNTRARTFYEHAGWALDGRTKVESVADGAVTLEEVRYRLALR
ncbi:GNAT family N-acetyltransferase [Amycolatopsis sp. NPDC051903]|uniref:GNAT family N-acetyltransferase n=1 Tax=Amycolatopsis sp. NPDC051903 TaxID=3363936 RepID=UPI0037A24699